MTAEESLTPAAPATVPNPTAGMTIKVVKGSLWTLAGQVAPLAVSLITTPFVIRMLGAESYGVVILAGLLPTYLGFAEFGMGMASTKFASAAYAEGDRVREARIVRTAALIALCSSLPIALILFVFSNQVLALFKVPENLRFQGSLALKFAAVTAVINFLNSIFNTPQLTRLRMDLNMLVTSGFRILGLLATPLAIYYAGIVGAVFVLMVSSLLTLLGHLMVSERLNGHLFERTIDRQAIRPLMKFGGALVGASIAALLLTNLEKGVLSAFASVSALAYYTVAFTLANMLTMFSNSMIQSLIPAFSQLQGSESRSQKNSLYTRAIRINLIWLFPVLVFLSIVAKPFFTFWAGKDFGSESVLPFYLIMIGLVFNIPAYLPYSAIMAAGKTDIFAKLYFAELVPYIGLVTILTHRFGAVGAAAAWSIRIVVDALFQFHLAQKTADVRFLGINSSFAVGVLMLLVPFALNILLPDAHVIIFTAFILSLVVYTVLLWKLVLDDDELKWLFTQLRSRFGV